MLGKMHVMCYATCLYNNLLFSVVAAIVPSCLCALKAYNYAGHSYIRLKSFYWLKYGDAKVSIP